MIHTSRYGRRFYQYWERVHTYTLSDRYDFDEWKGTKRNEIVIWLNDTFRYDAHQDDIIHYYNYTVTDSYYIYAYID